MKPTHFQIEFTNERIIPSGGLTLVGYILENSGFIDRLNRYACRSAACNRVLSVRNHNAKVLSWPAAKQVVW